MTTPNFTDLALAEPILRAVTETGYTTPTPIQAQAIPQVLAGGDLMAAAQTGTGKTAGFTLPLLHRLHTSHPANARPGRPRALVLTPTRELAAQVEESVRTYGKYVKLNSMVMFGGVGFNPQASALRKHVDILVATPGRLLDHANQKTVDLSGIEILVLDEADRMLDMGFIRDIKKVLALLPKVRQNLLFSATFSDEIKTLADGLLDNPRMVEVARRNTANELVDQRVHLVDRDKKTELLTELIQAGDWHQVLVFTRTKHGANRLAEKLTKSGIESAAIHGNKSQGARTKALADFKTNTLQVLVATDIAARGLDIDLLPHVVNFELPNVPEDYVHRIGRTGRAGSSGEAVSLVCVDEFKLLKDIEKLIKKSIPQFIVPGYEADLSVTPEPIMRGGGGGGGGGRQQQGQRRGQGSAGQGRSQTNGHEINGNSAKPKPAGEHRHQSKPHGHDLPRGQGKPASAKPSGPRAQGDARRAPAKEVNGNVAEPRREAHGNRRTPPRQTAALFSAPPKKR
jgi:ATP-dependent RNA helicase RhlE